MTCYNSGYYLEKAWRRCNICRNINVVVTMSLKEGDIAPWFSNNTDSSSSGFAFLSSYLGKNNVVLYFYPKDNTPGCTKQAEDFRDAYQEFADLDTIIIGVSKDSASSHENFKKRLMLPFELIADVDTVLSQSYGVLVEKSMFGKSYMGIDRSTFLIDQKGMLRKIWRSVKICSSVSPNRHVDDVLNAVKGL